MVDGKYLYYSATSTPWTEHPGRARYYDPDMENLAKTISGIYAKHSNLMAEMVRIEPVLVEVMVEEFVDGNPDWLNAVRSHAVTKLTPIEIDALGLESHSLFQKMAQQPKKRGRR